VSGVGVRFDLSDVDRLARRIEALKRADRSDLSEQLGATMESQIRTRISDTKQTPEGDPWPAWSRHYAETRHGGQSLLQAEGDLLDSITYVADDDGAEAGTNVIYAAVHQFGASQGEFGRTGRGAPIPFGDIPARPFVGIGDEDLVELEGVMDDWVDAQLGVL